MPSQNEHTGDRLVTKVPSDAYKENYDKIFGKKPEKFFIDEEDFGSLPDNPLIKDRVSKDKDGTSK